MKFSVKTREVKTREGQIIITGANNRKQNLYYINSLNMNGLNTPIKIQRL